VGVILPLFLLTQYDIPRLLALAMVTLAYLASFLIGNRIDEGRPTREKETT
jgi:hypothetical protein